jgi:hypothetical protein
MIGKLLEMIQLIMNSKSDYRMIEDYIMNCKIRTAIELTRVGIYYGQSGTDIWSNTKEFAETITKIHKEEPGVFVNLYRNLENIQKEIEYVKSKEKILV